MIKKKWHQWIAQRFQVESNKTLKQRDVLIFMHQHGFLYVVLILITFIAGMNYANNLILGFCFLIAALLCVSFYLTFKQLHQLQLQIVFPEIARVNQSAIVQLHFHQAIVQQRYFYVEFEQQLIPVHLDQTTKMVELHVLPHKRGAQYLSAIRLYSTYPLGLVRAWTYVLPSIPIWVAPEAQNFHLEHQADASLGESDFDEFKELRNYQVGDSLHAVSWKQVARGQGLYIKQFEDQRDTQMVHIDYAQMLSSDHETKLSLMMGLVDQCEKLHMQYQVQIGAQLIAPTLGNRQYIRAQLMLAQVR